MTKAHGYAAQSKTSPLAPFQFQRRDVGPRDVQIEILYCGVCHSDIHQVRDEWGGSIYPMVPGHEIVGRVARIGADVSKFKEGDLAGVETPSSRAAAVKDRWRATSRNVCSCGS